MTSFFSVMDLQSFFFILFCLANKLGDDGAKYIADVLKVNTTLKSLDIGCESFFCCYYVESEEAKFVLKTMLSAKQSLVSKKVSDNTVRYHNQIKPEIQ